MKSNTIKASKSELRTLLKLDKIPDGYDVIYDENRIGCICKGWARLGGAGWVVIFNSASNLQRINSSKKSLELALDAILDRIVKSYDKTESNAL